MRRNASDEKVVVGQIEKSGTEIVRVIRLRLNGYELVSLPVFSCGRKSGVTEKGLTLHLEQWRTILPIIQRALDLELHEAPKRKPARKKTSDPDTDKPKISVNSNIQVPAPAKRVPARRLSALNEDADISP